MSQLTSAMTHRVCTAAPPPPESSFIHAFVQLLIVLFGLRPGIIPVSSHQPKSFLSLGSFIFSEISVGCDGLLNWYADRDKVTIPDMEEAFKKHLKWNKHLPDPYFVTASPKVRKMFEGCSVMGVTISASGFYGPQGRVVRQPLAMPDMIADIESFRFGDYRITNFEMEGSALAGLATQLGHDAGTICCAIANRYLKDANTDYKKMVRNLIELSLDRITQDR